MAKRNVWEYEETKAMLSIMEEQNVMKHFDGKMYKNTEIYRKIEKELIKQGYESKSDKQIETRWKNLKKKYIVAKKCNNRSGSNREMCDFYEELDRMLGCRPSVNAVNAGVDTSRTEENDVANLEGGLQSEPTPRSVSPVPSTSADAQRKEERRTYGRGSYARCIEKLGSTIKNTQEALNKEFFENQKKLIDYEFNLYVAKEVEFEEKFNEATKKMLDDTTSKFLAGLSNLLNQDRTSNVRDFFGNFSVDD